MVNYIIALTGFFIPIGTETSTTGITIVYLTMNVTNYSYVDKHPGGHSAHFISLMDYSKDHKKETIKRLKSVPPSDYHKDDWLQIINVIYQIYLFHDPEQPEVFVRFFSRSLPNKVIKAHFEEACRHFLETLPAKGRDEGLDALHALITQIKKNKNSLKRLHSILV